MAIAFGASLGGATNAFSLTSLSITGDNLVILYAHELLDTTTTVATLKWDDGSGGSAQDFTQHGTYQTFSGSRVSLWYLLNPNTSNSRIIATLSGANPGSRLCAVYYSGVAQSSTFTTASQQADASSPGAETDTSEADDSWHIGTAASNDGSLAVGADTTQRVEETDNVALYDSNATVANTATHTFNWSWGGAAESGFIGAMMKPAAAAGGVARRRMMVGIGS